MSKVDSRNKVLPYC